LILYRKAAHLRVQRAATPEPPYWAATSIAPYGPKRGSSVSIDYLDLRASYVARSEVTVCLNVREELERATRRQPLHDPVLVDATELAELIFGRGGDILEFCGGQECAVIVLVSTRGALPHDIPADATVVICPWPLEFHRLEPLFAEASARRLRWGVAIPVIFPVTTSLPALAEIAESSQRNGASFLASMSIELEATAKHALAESLSLRDDETYDLLFHADLDPIHIATERHIAAVAAEIGIEDFIVPPRWSQRSNWNAAVLLTLAASRMFAMKHDVELAGRLARSARVIAELDKPIARVAEAARLSIVESLDDISVDALTEWIESGRSSFVEHINKQWRLRRDSGM
jgi:hypothetical protein